MSWDNYTYKKPVYEENQPGNYRCIILNAEQGVSKTSGNRMLIISLRPSGTRATVKTYIVDNDRFDDNFSQFLDAFPMLKNNPSVDNCFAWRGAIGAAKFNVNDNGYFEVKRFIPAEKTANYPDFEWKARDDEAQEMPVLQEFTELSDDDGADDDIPF